MQEPRTTSRNWPRSLLLGWVGWTAYSILYAAVLTKQSGVFFPYSLSASLASHYLMSFYSLPVWFLITRVLAQKRWPWHLLGHLIAGPLFAYAWLESFLAAFRSLFGEETWQQAQLFTIEYWLLHEALIVYAVFAGVFYVWRYQRQLRERERDEAALRLHTNKMELAVLKAQLNPHFLFNTLNSINALVGSNPEGARQVLARFAEVLRYSLESDRRAMVPLAEELRFVETYLDIEKARFGKRLQVQLEIDNAARSLLVPPMILQPLAENAVRHGIAPKEEGGELSVRIQPRNGRLEIEVVDNGVGTMFSSKEELLHYGTGLRNTDLRLRKMFGEESGLQINNGTAGFAVKFCIPVVPVP